VRVLAVLAASAAVAASGCGGGSDTPEEQPVEFLEALFGQLYRGEHGAAWESLYGAHQNVVTRQRYVACEANAPAFPGQFDGVEVLRTREEDWQVPGDDGKRESTAVTYRITVSLGGDPERITGTGHLLAEHGAWRWILNDRDFKAYRAGRCPVTGG